MEYTVDYFIKKFERIPEMLWRTHSVGEEGGPRCANGHTYGRYCRNEETEGLNAVFKNLTITAHIKDDSLFNEYIRGESPSYSRVAEQINNGYAKEYQQPTPKQRVLAALYDIKAAQQPEIKERIVYVMVDQPVKELVKSEKALN
jgi:hypothetical protein